MNLWHFVLDWNQEKEEWAGESFTTQFELWWNEGKNSEKKKWRRQNTTYAERTTFNWMLVFYTTHTHVWFQIRLHHWNSDSISHPIFLSPFFLFTPKNFLYRKYKWFKPTGQKLNRSENKLTNNFTQTLLFLFHSLARPHASSISTFHFVLPSLHLYGCILEITFQLIQTACKYMIFRVLHP